MTNRSRQYRPGWRVSRRRLSNETRRVKMSLNHPIFRTSLVAAAVAAMGLATFAQAETQRFEPTFPEPKEGQYVHTPPTMEDLEASSLHPELKRVIRKGRDMFMNTQQYRGEYEIGRAHV